MISVQSMNFAYGSKEIFRNVNLEFRDGDFVFIVGESGIGKTTFLKLLYFDLFPKKGKIVFEDYESSTIDKTEIPVLRRKLGIVFQDFKLLHDRNVFENIALPLYITRNRKEFIRSKVFETASNLGLVNLLNKMPYDLSGGEQQRVAIARAIVNNPSVFIADEPTGNLDPFISHDIIKQIADINNKGTTIVVATHNFDIVKKFSDKRILQIKEGQLFDVRVKT